MNVTIPQLQWNLIITRSLGAWKLVQDRPHWINTVTLFFDIYTVFWWFLVNMKVLIPNPLGARRETLSIFHNMQIIQNGRHDVIDKYISLVCRHKQIYLMAFCQYRGADSKSAGFQTWNLVYLSKYANYSKWPPWRHRQTHLPCFLTLTNLFDGFLSISRCWFQIRAVQDMKPWSFFKICKLFKMAAMTS